MASLSRFAEFAEVLRRKLYQAGLPRVSPRETVLDVGSGNAPNWRANILCDKFAADASERLGSPIAYPAGRPFIVGDALRLPFRDQAFDYVVCSHVLEHVEEPRRLLQELQRVARGGYLETPSRVWEKLHSWPYHKWLVSSDEGTIILEEKPAPLWDPELAQWLQRQVATRPLFQRLWMRYWEYDLAFQHWWSGPLRCEVRRAETSTTGFVRATAEDGQAAEQVPTAAPGMMARLDATYGRWLRRRSQARLGHWRELLACPVCRGGLQGSAEAERLSCEGCGAAYPQQRGVPVLLEEARL